MRTIFLDNQAPALAPNVATIGFFDGVHRGHQHLIKQVKDVAARAGEPSTVITFNQHPRQTLRYEYKPQLLSTLKEKLAMIEKTGVDNTVVLHFDNEMAQMTAQEFMKRVLKERLQVNKLVIGHDNRFGYGRAEGFDDYVRYGEMMGIEVVHADAFTLDGGSVSSSVIRQMLQHGNIEAASLLLGYDYTISGTVIGGHREGSRLGFPTANIDAKSVQKLIPTNGVYAVKVGIAGSSEQYIGMTNIGRRPTFAGTDTTIETNIFDFNDDLYDKEIAITLCHRLRDEQRFGSLEQLAQQLMEDRKEVERMLK